MEDSRRRPVQAILFDLDGTLLDTSDDFVHTLNRLLADDDRPPLPAQLIRSQVSNGSAAMVTLGYGLQPSDDDFEPQRQRFLKAYQQHTSQADRDTSAHLFDGMDELLAAIETSDIPWGIVTNKPRHLTVPILEQLKLSQRCAVLVCPEDVANRKPDPESLWLATETLDCSPEACLYVGDHERDIQAGQAAGMFTFAALYGFIPAGEDPDDWRADYNVDSPQHLLEWLDDWDWQLPDN
ncbi:HAD family hydrolase [Parendozoicomonas haliclonae]|uniref:Phosphoglycolate phosphatase n=1 Tax=Parendozoicomonas haliclonae TaxID=1960125 RepID=A0A1X7AHH0_9GAMM|nr:HAD-IA family hydrolase [Parendozoicomonas haliclonae]SMA41617.1 Phosphoglycolate phosphatase [Parendozoicomonas haliclonae]